MKSTLFSVISYEGNGKLLLSSFNILDWRTGQPFSVEINHDDNGYTFADEEDRVTFADGFSAYRVARNPDFVLESFMDGFWDIIRDRSIFRTYTMCEVRRLIGGVTEIEWCVIGSVP